VNAARRRLLRLAAALPLAGCARVNHDPVLAKAARLRPLFRPKLPPQAGDWLAEHHEAGQSYAQYRSVRTRRTVDTYSTLRVVPIGDFSWTQIDVHDAVLDFIKPFFGLTLQVDEPIKLADIPDSAKRDVAVSYTPQQLLTTWLLNDALPKRRHPEDAAVLGLTATDLWPGPGWNFVFGQASLTERVGVWSMARNGWPDNSPQARELCTLRTLKTATHETGHMLGIPHCIAWECGMNGSNHEEEHDRQPLEFCPECQPKLWWTLGLDPLKRSQALAASARKSGLASLASFFDRQSVALDQAAG